ncbi:hypothetical protein GGF31_008119 [Allomyces arbusculus]|nr:hypothetical protein GGF31_008119 [Allomyces arbusculus]
MQSIERSEPRLTRDLTSFEQDIRSFFRPQITAGASSSSSATPAPAAGAARRASSLGSSSAADPAPKRKRAAATRARIIISDDDEDDDNTDGKGASVTVGDDDDDDFVQQPPKKSRTSATPKPKPAPAPKPPPVTPSAYFGALAATRKAAPLKSSSSSTPAAATSTATTESMDLPSSPPSSTTATVGRPRRAAAKKEVVYMEDDEDEEEEITATKSKRKRDADGDAFMADAAADDDDDLEDDDQDFDLDDDFAAPPPRAAAKKVATPKKSVVAPKADPTLVAPAAKTKVIAPPAAAKSPPAKKAKVEVPAAVDDDNDDEVMPLGAKNKKLKKVAPLPPAPTAATASPSTPNPDGPVDMEDDAKARSKAAYLKYQSRAGPTALGSKEVPEGADNCLHGLTFVQTGDFSSFTRDDVKELIMRYGGRMTGAVSGKTSYLLVGADGGATKIKKATELKTPLLDEDQFLDLIRTRPGKSEAQVNATKSKTVLAKEQKLATIDYAQVAANPHAMWVDKYKPSQPTEIIGNQAAIGRLSKWLSGFDQARKNRFKFTGDQNFTHFRAALISGAPGIGKTTAAHVVAKSLGYHIVEFNASDVRSKKSLDDVAAQAMGNQTLFAFQNMVSAGNGGNAAAVKPHHVIIMDEVDGMSGSDRGGLAELTVLIKKSQVPIICIANDTSSPRMRTFKANCLELKFARPDAQHIRSRLMTICHREGLKLAAPAIDALVASTNRDIRQVLHLLSTYKLGVGAQGTLAFDEGKALGKSAEKDMAVGLFDAARECMTLPYARKSLPEQLEVYFNDYDMIPLMMQENYIKMRASHDPVQALEGLSAAADAIATGDHIGRSIRSNQNWSLLPSHGTWSTVAPAMAMMSRPGSTGCMGMIMFSSVLGQGSKVGKGQRQLDGLHLRMSRGALGHGGGGRSALRLDTIPALAMITPAMFADSERHLALMDMLDAYYLGRDDFDTIFELGVGKAGAETALKPIPAAVKSRFTREYNKRSHPVAWTEVPKTVGKGRRGTAPAADEELGEEGLGVMDEDGEAEVVHVDDEEEDDDPEALRAALAKNAPAPKGKGRGARGGAAAAKPAGRGRGRGRGRGKAAAGDY